jgi:hypothetical protein
MRSGIFLSVLLAGAAGLNGWATAGPVQATVSLGQVASLPGTEVLASVYFTASSRAGTDEDPGRFERIRIPGAENLKLEDYLDEE